MKTKIFTCAHVPPALEKSWLQHLRDFDVANPGCHFEVYTDAPEQSFSEVMEMVQINPGLTFAKLFERQKP